MAWVHTNFTLHHSSNRFFFSYQATTTANQIFHRKLPITTASSCTTGWVPFPPHPLLISLSMNVLVHCSFTILTFYLLFSLASLSLLSVVSSLEFRFHWFNISATLMLNNSFDFSSYPDLNGSYILDKIIKILES